MKIAVTGGAGFIGSQIADRYISLGHDVVIIDNFFSGFQENLNPKAKFVKMDITDNAIEDLFLAEKFDIVSHHAAQMDVRVSVRDPKFDAYTNIIGGINIYEACVKSCVKKVIFASSGGTVYGEQNTFPADEDHSTRPCSPYGISKLTNEKYLFFYKETYGLDYVVFRYGNVYGPRQNPHGEAGVVAIFTSKMIAGEQPVINGDGLTTRDYVFINDVVKANTFAIENGFSGTYNVGTGIETNTNQIFYALKDALQMNCEEVHGAGKPGEQRRAVISPERLRKVCGWAPATPLAEGMKITVEHYKALKNK